MCCVTKYIKYSCCNYCVYFMSALTAVSLSGTLLVTNDVDVDIFGWACTKRLKSIIDVPMDSHQIHYTNYVVNVIHIYMRNNM